MPFFFNRHSATICRVQTHILIDRIYYDITLLIHIGAHICAFGTTGQDNYLRMHTWDGISFYIFDRVGDCDNDKFFFYIHLYHLLNVFLLKKNIENGSDSCDKTIPLPHV